MNPSIWALGAPSVKHYESVSWISGWTAVSSWLSDRELWMVLSSSKCLGSYEFLLGKKSLQTGIIKGVTNFNLPDNEANVLALLIEEAEVRLLFCMFTLLMVSWRERCSWTHRPTLYHLSELR